MKLKVVLEHEESTTPTKNNEKDSDYDLYAVADRGFKLGYFDRVWGFELQPGERHVFDIGIRIGFEKGYSGKIEDRSGLACNNGATVLAGVIDNGFTGVMKVCLLNTGDKMILVRPGDRIAQIKIRQDIESEIEIVESLEETIRGDKGFGSSGR